MSLGRRITGDGFVDWSSKKMNANGIVLGDVMLRTMLVTSYSLTKTCWVLSIV